MIEIDRLRKCFGSLVAVDDVSFQVGPGEVLGFLGPNGAGKSTTMKLITGFLVPTSGRIKVAGHDIETSALEAQRQIGYLPEGAPCYEEMTTYDFLKFIAEVRGFKGKERESRIVQVVDRMSLGSVLDQRIETLSKGFKRRVGLAQAILHDPMVLILDEPTDGLDPNQKHQVREMIRGLSRDKIVIISTHILEEVTAVCTRALIIAGGRLVMDCKPAELEQRSRYHGAITVRLESAATAAGVSERLSRLEGIDSVERSADELEITVFKQDPAIDLLQAVSDLARDPLLGVTGVYQEKGRLDEVFRQLTQGEAGVAA